MTREEATRRNTMQNELKPCPFCGGEAIVVKTERCGRYVGCWDCGGRTEEFETDYAGSAHDKAIAAWNRRTQPEITGNTSDGYHTFNELYHHRAILFSVICNDRLDRAWKSKMHHDGTMYDGMFIVGIQTPNGQATYHYDIDPYWDMFRVPELSQAPKWDGHTPAQAIERIGRLTQPENKPLTLDELRQMDGEPVYVVRISGAKIKMWVIACPNEYGLTQDRNAESQFMAWSSYGRVWLAYRCKPKEESK